MSIRIQQTNFVGKNLTSNSSCQVNFQANNSQNEQTLTKNKRTEKGHPILGSILGFMSFGLMNKISQRYVGKISMNAISNNKGNIPYNQVKPVVDGMLTKGKLASTNGFALHYVSWDNVKLAENLIKENINKTFSGKFQNFIYKAASKDETSPIIQIIAGQTAKLINQGKNALYLDKLNVILSSKENPLTALHETGHAINFNSRKLPVKLLTKLRTLPAIAVPLILITSLIKGKNNDNNSKPSGIGDFLKKHAGSLTFLSFIPMITEEGLASWRGINFAKNAKDWTKPMLNTLKKSLAIGLASYVAFAGTTALAMKIAIAIRDKIAEPKTKN